MVYLNLKKNVLANTFSKLSSSITRIVQVPLFLNYLGQENYGYWILIYSLPSFLSLANVGIGTYTSNQIAIYSFKGEFKLAKKAYSTAIITLSLLFVFIIVAFYLILNLFSFNSIFGVREIVGQDFKATSIFIASTILVSFFYETYNGLFRSVNKAHMYNFLSGILPLLNLLAIYIVFQFTVSFKILAFGILVSNIIFLLILIFISGIYNKIIYLNVSDFSFKELKYIFKNGLSFQLFSLSHAIQIQGNLFVIQYLLGPIYVALFNTVRTVVNATKQIQDVFSASFWPELTSAMAVGNYTSAKNLHRSGVLISVLISAFVIMVLYFSSHIIFELWLNNSMTIPKDYFAISLIGVIFYSFWYPSSIVHFALNQQASLSYIFFMVSILQIFLCFLLTKVFHLSGAPFALSVFDIVMIPVVFSRSLKLTHDTKTEFFKGMGEIIKNMVIVKLMRK